MSGQRENPSLSTLLIFFLLFANSALFPAHCNCLTFPYFWDELGQFVPTALDLLRTGALVPHSVIPNVHPPGRGNILGPMLQNVWLLSMVTRLAMLFIWQRAGYCSRFSCRLS